jgi:hypothetical protein
MSKDETPKGQTIDGSDGAALLRAIERITSWEHGKSVTLNGSVVHGDKEEPVKLKATMIDDKKAGRTIILDYFKPQLG